MPSVLVPVSRMVRWVENFTSRHGETRLAVDAGALTGAARDGSSFIATLPFDGLFAGLPAAAVFAEAAAAPEAWGVLLVRRGGFAIARMTRESMTDHKIGQRHVQGKTKAGGWSQQRYARRRANQAHAAYEAAADHAARILDGLAGPVVTGGDHSGVEAVLDDPRLQRLQVSGPWLPVPDPNRAVLDKAVLDAQSVRIEVLNA